MGALLVTVMGARPRDVAVPDDVPVQEIIPALLEECGTPAAIRDVPSWSLAVAGRTPLHDEQSLQAGGVLDGDVLFLKESGPWGDQAGPSRERDVAPPELDLTTLLPSRLTSIQRMMSAARALVDRRPRATDHGVQSSEDGYPTFVRRPAGRSSPLARARASWHASCYERRLDNVISGPRLHRCVTIAVVAPRRGVGATTLTVLLGTLLSHLRPGRVVAMDTGEGPGSLTQIFGLGGHRGPTGDPGGAPSDPDGLPPAVHRRLGPGEHALRVLPSPNAASPLAHLHDEASDLAIRRLKHLADVILVDCSAGLHSATTRAAVLAADQIVLVSDLQPETAGTVAEAAELLVKTGCPIALMVNRTPLHPSRADLQALAGRVPRAGVVVVVPDEPAAAAAIAADDFTWDAAPDSWRIAVREDLVVLVAQWRALGLTTPEAPAMRTGG